MLDMPANVVAALASNNYRTAMLIDLPGTDMQVTDNQKNIVYDGITFSNTGRALIKASGINRAGDLNASSYSVTFYGGDTLAYQDYVGDQQLGKPGRVFLAFLDENYLLLSADSVIQLYAGLVDQWQFDETKTSSEFTVKMASHWSAFEVQTGRFTNSSSQEEYYPGDTFFQYAQQEKLPFKWGQ